MESPSTPPTSPISSPSGINITEELKTLDGTDQKISKLENIFEQQTLTRKELSLVKYHCTVLATA